MYKTALIMTLMNIVAWNVRGIMSSAVPLSHILQNQSIDIGFISEHKLLPQSIDFLNSLHPDYCAFATVDTTVNPYSKNTCGKAGTAIIYKKNLHNVITRIETQNERIIGIEFKPQHSTPLYMFCVYMPADNIMDYYKTTI